MGYVIAWLDKEIQRAKDALDAKAGGIGMRWYKFLCRAGLLLAVAYMAWMGIALLTGVSYMVYGLSPDVVYGDYGPPLCLLDRVVGAISLMMSLLTLTSWHGLIKHRWYAPVMLYIVSFCGPLVAFLYVTALTLLSMNRYWMAIYLCPIVLLVTLAGANWQYFQRRKAMFDQRGAVSCD